MKSQKRDRIVAAVTVNVVLLLVILVGVMVYQLVTIFVLNKNKDEIEKEYSSIVSQIESMESVIETITDCQDRQELLDYILDNWDIYGSYFTNGGSTSSVTVEYDEAYIRSVED